MRSHKSKSGLHGRCAEWQPGRHAGDARADAAAKRLGDARTARRVVVGADFEKQIADRDVRIVWHVSNKRQLRYERRGCFVRIIPRFQKSRRACGDVYRSLGGETDRDLSSERDSRIVI